MTLQLIAMRLDMEVCLMPSDDDRFVLLNQLMAENKQLTERVKEIDKLVSEIRKISHDKETL